MGAEEFQATLASQLSSNSIARRLRKEGSFRELKLHGSRREQFVYEDELHFVEIEVYDEDGLGRLSFKFALCQFDSADACFALLLARFAREFGAMVMINDEVEPGDPWEFSPNEENQIADVLQRAIRNKRSLWVADFGDERAKLTCADAIRRFIVEGTPAQKP